MNMVVSPMPMPMPMPMCFVIVMTVFMRICVMSMRVMIMVVGMVAGVFGHEIALERNCHRDCAGQGSYRASTRYPPRRSRTVSEK
ncbi:hypothetical protein ASAP_0975 [Asaia bogorensis]|uniref:Uncharacterized protein n=1 Tax=Asaia bogorensis TaxID=91915 RepID=A0A060QDK7_9PROT|nr:hypothetical protein ASAP_0975 [Asaia bogorensis]